MAHASGIEESNAEIVAGDVKADTITVNIKDQVGILSPVSNASLLSISMQLNRTALQLSK